MYGNGHLCTQKRICMEFLAAFILAFLVTLIFAMGYRGSGSSLTQIAVLFFILFMAGIAGQYWIMPFGPVLWGISWLPLLFIVLVVTLLFAAPPPYPVKKRKAEEKAEDSPVKVVISIGVWLILLALLIAAIIGYNKTAPRMRDRENRNETAS